MMAKNLILSLQISLVGMGLVFAALILLWLLMLALNALTNEKKKMKNKTTEEYALKKQAAALAVASAIAEQSKAGVSRFPVPPTAIVSAWQLSMRTRQMNNELRRILS